MNANIYFAKDGTYICALKEGNDFPKECYEYRVLQTNFSPAPGIFEYFYDKETGKVKLITGEEHDAIVKATRLVSEVQDVSKI